MKRPRTLFGPSSMLLRRTSMLMRCLSMLLMLAAGLPAVLAADGPAAVGPVSSRSSRLQLRAQAAVAGRTVSLADVLSFAQADPQIVEQIADQPAVAELGATAKVVVTHAQVVRRLDELGVNLSRVLVSGALQCEVTLDAAPVAATPAASNTDAAAGPLLRAAAPSGTPGAKTLADIVREHVNRELAPLGEVADLAFERAGQEYLALTTPPWDFTVSSAGGDKLGLRELRVTVRRDGRLHQTVHVMAQVRVARQVVVAQRPLSIGNIVRRDDLTFETRVFEREGALGVTRVEEVIGQEVKRFIPGGEMVQPDALRARALVQRSQPVTVTGDGESVQIRLTGEALDSGSYGDTVRVRIGDGRRRQQVLRGVVTGVSTVRLAEGAL